VDRGVKLRYRMRLNRARMETELSTLFPLEDALLVRAVLLHEARLRNLAGKRRMLPKLNCFGYCGALASIAILEAVEEGLCTTLKRGGILDWHRWDSLALPGNNPLRDVPNWKDFLAKRQEDAQRRKR
jgi:hypothetical protein